MRSNEFSVSGSIKKGWLRKFLHYQGRYLLTKGLQSVLDFGITNRALKEKKKKKRPQYLIVLLVIGSWALAFFKISPQ